MHNVTNYKNLIMDTLVDILADREDELNEQIKTCVWGKLWDSDGAPCGVDFSKYDINSEMFAQACDEIILEFMKGEKKS